MKSRAVRLTLFLLFVIALGATAYLFWLGETRMRVESYAARDYESRAFDAIRELHALRSAQQAYVAAGQGDQFWVDRVATSLGQIKEAAVRLRATSASPEAVAAIDSASAILQDFEQMDQRVRDYVRGGQRLLASDMIFSDGLELTAAGMEAVQRAASAEGRLQDETREGIRRRQLYAVGSAAAAALLIALLLLPVPRAEANEPVSLTLAGHDAETEAEGLADIEPALEEGWGRAVPLTVAPAPAPPAPAALATPAAPAVEMTAVASLCTDLARLADTGALPALLERAAATLEASGIVLWIADPDGRELSPSSHTATRRPW
jgi:hypothetical protein